MQIHIAIFRWKPEVSIFDIEAALQDVCVLQSHIPGIVEISTGTNCSKYAAGYSHVVLVRADNQVTLEAYRNHPKHIEIAKKIDDMEEHGIGIDFTTAS